MINDKHNDTYAGTGHRMFFANYVKGKAPRKCPDNDGHNTDALDGLVNLPPVVSTRVTSPCVHVAGELAKNAQSPNEV